MSSIMSIRQGDTHALTNTHEPIDQNDGDTPTPETAPIGSTELAVAMAVYRLARTERAMHTKERKLERARADRESNAQVAELEKKATWSFAGSVVASLLEGASGALQLRATSLPSVDRLTANGAKASNMLQTREGLEAAAKFGETLGKGVREAARAKEATDQAEVQRFENRSREAERRASDANEASARALSQMDRALSAAQDMEAKRNEVTMLIARG